jgi:hypothetical protein
MFVSTLEPRQEAIFVLKNYVIKRDAIRAFGLYFSKIREFASESVPLAGSNFDHWRGSSSAR